MTWANALKNTSLKIHSWRRCEQQNKVVRKQDTMGLNFKWLRPEGETQTSANWVQWSWGCGDEHRHVFLFPFFFWVWVRFQTFRRAVLVKLTNKIHLWTISCSRSTASLALPSVFSHAVSYICTSMERNQKPVQIVKIVFAFRKDHLYQNRWVTLNVLYTTKWLHLLRPKDFLVWPFLEKLSDNLNKLLCFPFWHHW